MAHETRKQPNGIAELTVMVGDIAVTPRLARASTVIVSADDNRLSHGGGVSKRLWDVGGEDVARVAFEGSLSVGDVLAGPAGELPADVLLHAVTMDLDQRVAVGATELEHLYGRVLDCCLELDGDVVVSLPLLGTGVVGLSPRMSAAALGRAMASRWHVTGRIRLVRLVVLDERVEDEAWSALGLWRTPTWGWGGLLEVLSKCPEVAALIGDDEASASRPLSTSASDGWVDEVRLFRLLLEAATARLLGSASPVESGLALKVDASALSVRLEIGGDRPASAAALVERMLLVDTLSPSPLSAEVRADLRAAVAARNRLVHDSGAAFMERARLRHHVRLAIRHLARLLMGDDGVAIKPASSSPDVLVKSSAGAASSQWASVWSALSAAAATVVAESSSAYAAMGAGVGGVAAPTLPTPSRSGAQIRKAKSVVEAVPEPSHPRGTTAATISARLAPSPSFSDSEPVRNLHRFLLENLSEERLNEIAEDLRAAGYKGAREDRLLELCVHVPDLVAFVADELGRRVILKALCEQGAKAHAWDTDGRVLAAELLVGFGFPRSSVITGLGSIRGRLEQLATRAQSPDTTFVRGTVMEAGTLLEYALRVVLLMACRELWGEPADLWLRGRGLLEPSRELRTCSLGTLVRFFVDGVVRAVEEGTFPSAISERFEARQDYSALATPLPTLRNSFAHLKDERAQTAGEVTANARDFFSSALRFVDLLGSNGEGVFPIVVQVERIVVDRWGRRVVEAVDDQGRLERLFTDEIVRPGERYLMRTHTNPMRVDPFLVPLGQMDEVSATKAATAKSA